MNRSATIVLTFLSVLLLVLCGCGKNEITVGSFSYTDTLNFYADETAGIKRDGFVNTEKCDVSGAEHAIELAKKECITEWYDTISVRYDEKEKIYCVDFSIKNAAGGCLSVYLNSEGITLLTVAGE